MSWIFFACAENIKRLIIRSVGIHKGCAGGGGEMSLRGKALDIYQALDN
jgi:hypothetical protein